MLVRSSYLLMLFLLRPSSTLLRPLSSNIHSASRLFASSSSSSSSSSSASQPNTGSYFTDVEGDINYLNRFINLSSVLSRPDPSNPSDLHLSPNSHVVFGGDAVDRGGFDIMTLTLLSTLKDKYPDNVHFVMGNRDCNKLRLRSELGEPKSPTPPRHKGVYWFKGRDLVGDPLLDNVPATNVERLKWLLQKTMGCPNTFELRKNELKVLRSSDDVSDEDVVESYRELCSPGGLMANHIMRSKVAIKMGPCLFVHAAVPRDPEVKDDRNWGFKTYPPHFDTPAANFQEWLGKVNTFVDEQKQDWIDGSGGDKVWSTTGGYSKEKDAGGSLMQYGMGYVRKGTEIFKNPTPIYATWLKDGKPHITPYTEKIFDEAGVSLIVTGHQPHGVSQPFFLAALCSRILLNFTRSPPFSPFLPSPLSPHPPPHHQDAPLPTSINGND
jgi:hypothetical protein